MSDELYTLAWGDAYWRHAFERQSVIETHMIGAWTMTFASFVNGFDAAHLGETGEIVYMAKGDERAHESLFERPLTDTERRELVRVAGGGEQ